jgi:ribosomal protein S18 acetylase RimI-like enzyme
MIRTLHPITVTSMHTPDIARCAAINADARKTDRWGPGSFSWALQEVRIVPGVFRIDGIVEGFSVYEIHTDHYFVLNMGIAPEYRRRGYGSALIAEMKKHACFANKRMVGCYIRESNLEAQLFLRANNFLCVGVLRNHFGDEDGYDFRYTL